MQITIDCSTLGEALEKLDTEIAAGELQAEIEAAEPGDVIYLPYGQIEIS